MKGSIRILLSVVASMVLLSCSSMSGSNSIVIPDMDTAVQQYEVAYEAYYHAQSFVGDSDNKNKAVQEAKEAFKVVMTRFPEDDVYVPMADLMLARCELLTDDYRKAVAHYRKVLDRYAEDPRVQQIGLYELGVALDGAGRYQEAKDAYRELIDRFSNDPSIAKNEDAQKRLSEARRRYRIIRSE